MANLQPEFWLRGPVPGIITLLQPVAHALLQARAEIAVAVNEFPDSLLWEKPGGAASVAFHLQHLGGVLDRLFTYAKAEQLTPEQLSYLQLEGKQHPSITSAKLVKQFDQQVELALAYLTTLNDADLPAPREVGRRRIASNVLGLLFHAAEHTQRHTGQLLVTVRVVKTNAPA